MTEWKLVPVEPTQAMRDALASFIVKAHGFPTRLQPTVAYRAMLAAAPEPPADPRDGEIERLKGLAEKYETEWGKCSAFANRAIGERDAEIAALRALVDEARDIIVSAAPGQEVWLDAADEALRGEGK
jgi:hypothetical protein